MDATDSAGGAISCGSPVCTPTAINAPNATATCSYVCAAGALSLQPRVSFDGFTYSATPLNATTTTVNDSASACVNVSVPLFVTHAGANWSNPWVTCATASRTVITTVPAPAGADCASFTNYSVSVSAAVRQGTAPGNQLASAAAATTIACPLPSVAGSATYTLTSTYNWCVVIGLCVAQALRLLRACLHTPAHAKQYMARHLTRQTASCNKTWYKHRLNSAPPSLHSGLCHTRCCYRRRWTSAWYGASLATGPLLQ